MNPWHFVWISVLISEALTLAVSIIVCMFIWGRIIYEILAVGAVAVFFGSMVVYFIRQNDKLASLNQQLLREIEERRQVENEKITLEKQLQQSQKMEAIGTLAGGIAHDFNNILSIILGYAEMLQNDIEEETPAGRKLDQIIDAGDRATDLVKQILIFSRQVEEELIPLHVDIIVKETLKMLRAAIPSTIEISRNLSQQENMTVLASPTQIHQIMMNLCTNAYQSLEENVGKIIVSLSSVTIGPDEKIGHDELLPAGKYVLLEVSDNGAGISQENLGRIFDPYFTTKSKEEGTGLGLSVVHGIVKTLHGEITVESVVGQGTTFKIYLPFHNVQLSLRFDRDTDSLPGGNEKILLVDDEGNLVNMVHMMLEGLGYQVKSFTCAVDALYEFKRDPDGFDLVITDLTMPGISGDQFSQEVLKIKSNIPIILCTGFSNKITKEHALKIGIREFFLKPIQPAKLATTIRKIFDQPKKE
jgi:signal transduction histidine kinase/CheY-like chemotaxis protein